MQMKSFTYAEVIELLQLGSRALHRDQLQVIKQIVNLIVLGWSRIAAARVESVQGVAVVSGMLITGFSLTN